MPKDTVNENAENNLKGNEVLPIAVVVGNEVSESVKKTQSGVEEMIDLKCETCGTAYQKPKLFKEINDRKTNVFFRWSMTYCDKCRSAKEEQALKRLPEIMKAIESRSNIVEELKKLKKSNRPKL